MATTFRPRTALTLPPGDAMSWIIERAGERIGFLVLSLSGHSWERTRRAYIAGLYVEPEQRGKGVGALALRFAGDVGRSLGFKVYAVGVQGEDKMPPAPVPPRRSYMDDAA